MRLRKPKALIVEDDMLISLVERRLLERLNYEVVDVITKGEEVMHAFDKQQPDLVIMDICLEGTMNGIEAARALWKHTDLPIVFISGNSDLYLEAVSSFGIRHHTFISKPVSKKQLSDAIDKVRMGQIGTLKVA